MITIDGSYGEGGGQILRTALSLSLVTGKAFRISNIRAGRKTPGLMRQHLTAVNAAAEIGSAKIEGNRVGSQSFTFEPGAIQSGNYHFAIGSAGSCTLVFQTIMPALITADGPSEIVLEGGTHNPFAPPFDFLAKAFLPLINRMGPEIDAVLERPGFYPAGGGRFKASIKPAALQGIELEERGQILDHKARAVVANLPVTIAQRELKVIREKLKWGKNCLEAVEVEKSPGPGNILTAEVESTRLTEVFTGFGQRGVSAEEVASRTVKQVKEYLTGNVPVGRYLADQLLVPLALAGSGVFHTLAPTRHTRTNVGMIQKFLDVNIEITECEPNQWRVEIWNG
jgi:RNA 3'-terminal phosphate cyclase (ATP)